MVRGYIHECLIHRSNLKKNMLKEFNNDVSLKETIRFRMVGHDGKL